MAEVPVTLNGMLYDLLGRTTQRVVFIGDASYTNLGVGGGPMPGGPPLGFWGGVAPPLPTHPIAPGGPPPGIWGGAPPYPDIGGPGPQPHPEHPIVLPPVEPGGPPVQIWPSPGHPAHPIVLPDPPPNPPDEDGFVKPPPTGGGWAYHEDYGWLFQPAGQASSPKKAG
jgi:hypothetical protein